MLVIFSFLIIDIILIIITIKNEGPIEWDISFNFNGIKRFIGKKLSLLYEDNKLENWLINISFLLKILVKRGNKKLPIIICLDIKIEHKIRNSMIRNMIKLKKRLVLS